MTPNRVSEVDYLLTICKKNGITAQILEKECQDPTQHKRFLGIGEPSYKFKMENKKIDYLELYGSYRRSPDKICYYTCAYVILFEVGYLPGKYEATYQAIPRGFFDSNSKGFEWIANSRLSTELSKDTVLKEMLLNTSITEISVTPQVNHIDIKVVYHSQWPETWSQSTILAHMLRDLTAFERIAICIRGLKN